MLFKNDVAVRALTRIGSTQTIFSLDTENTTPAKVIRGIFRTSLDTVLERHNWGFARKFSALSLKQEDPMEAWRFAYGYPADALVIRRIDREGGFKHKVLNVESYHKFIDVYNDGPRTLYANLQDAWAEYTVRVSEDHGFPTHFASALSAQIGLDIAPALITNNYARQRNTLLAEASNDIARAIAEDIAREPQPDEEPSPFEKARYGG